MRPDGRPVLVGVPSSHRSALAYISSLALLMALACVTGCSSCASHAHHRGDGGTRAAPHVAPTQEQKPVVAQAPPEIEGAQGARPPNANDPLAGLDQLPTAAGTSGTPGTPPARGCAAQGAPSRVWSAAGPTAIVADGDTFVVAGYAPHTPPPGQDLFVVRIAPGAPPIPLLRSEVKPAPASPSAAPGLASTDPGHVTVAFVDGAGALHAGSVDTHDPSAGVFVRLAGGADGRFAPAVTATGAVRLVAYTDGTATPMRVRLVRLSGDRVVENDDVTPTAMGGAAPVFASGASPPELIFVDPRNGISPIVRVPIGADGTPGTGATLRPVGGVYEPPELAAARFGPLLTVGYTVVGNLAMTVVGLVRANGDAIVPNDQLVPATGYGVLHVGAVAAPSAAIFAADAPRDAKPTAPREVHVRLVDGDGLGPVLVLRGTDGTAHDPAVARRDDGIVGVAWASTDGEWVTFLRCAAP